MKQARRVRSGEHKLSVSHHDRHQHLHVEQIDGLIAAAGVDGTKAIMEAFWRSTTDLLTALAAQLGDSAFHDAAQTAHAIKGSAANVGAHRLSQSASEVEKHCKDSSAALELVERMQEEFAVLRKHFDAHINGG